MKPYPTYQDSGVEWIGEIPSHWDSFKLGRVLDVVESGKRETGGGNNLDDGVFSLGGEHILEDGKLSVLNPRFVSEEFYYSMNTGRVCEDDLLLVKDGVTIGKTTHITKLPIDKISINEHVYILRGKKNVENRFLYYNSRIRGFIDDVWNTVKTSVIPGLSSGFKNEVNITLPPLPEQKQIVSFLDDKTQKIDELIEKTEKKIELLKGKRTSLINHCVTKGLNSNVEIKDSGVEWIGEIPSSWDLIKLKYLCDITYGISPPDTTYNDEGMGIELVNGPVEYSETDFGYTRSLKWTTDPKKFTSKGSLLFCLRGSTTGRMNITHKDLSIGRGVCSLNSKESQWFMIYSMMILRIHIQKLISGSTFPSVTKDDVDNYVICRPRLEYQQQIVEYLDEQTQKIDTTIEKETERIELLKEYRQSLISEVVTGKVDVRDWNR